MVGTRSPPPHRKKRIKPVCRDMCRNIFLRGSKLIILELCSYAVNAPEFLAWFTYLPIFIYEKCVCLACDIVLCLLINSFGKR